MPDLNCCAMRAQAAQANSKLGDVKEPPSSLRLRVHREVVIESAATLRNGWLLCAATRNVRNCYPQGKPQFIAAVNQVDAIEVIYLEHISSEISTETAGETIPRDQSGINPTPVWPVD
ncbi:hypothetical protein [Paraburkholderia ultramafica]|uniref:hypothetical protein n=1 Tax=Paraburkholderia ultramafica TaxID=1544867 RepID=UPI001581C88E|nr:hypothetical protein [Paraburkholderia ultramafica]